MVTKLRSYVRGNTLKYVAFGAILAAAGTATAATTNLTGHGQRVQARFVVDATADGFLPTPKILATIPGMGTLKLIACFDSSGDNSVREQFIQAANSPAMGVVVDSIGWVLPQGPGSTSMEGSGRSSASVEGGGGTVRAVSAADATVGSAGRITWQISSGTGTNTKVATIVSTILNRSPITQKCEVAADVMLP